MRGWSHFTNGEVEAWRGEFALWAEPAPSFTGLWDTPPPPCSSSPTPTPNSLKEPPLSHCRPEKSSPPPPPTPEELRCHSAWGQME